MPLVRFTIGLQTIHPQWRTMGIQWHKGQGVKQAPAEALQWYRKAAGLGHAKSMTKIGFFYEDGRGVPKTPLRPSPGLRVVRAAATSAASTTTPACWPHAARWTRHWSGCAKCH